MNKISTTLIERAYGKHHFKAARLMTESMLLGSMLNNAESWININQTDLNNLENPDTILQNLILNTKGSPSKVFMYLELGILPVKYVIMKKGLSF